MRKLHLGSGGAIIDGWENHDVDVDLRKPLPYENNSVDFIFTEHVIEHLTQREAWNFFEECQRVLKPGGIVRTTVPSIVKLKREITQDYATFVKTNGWGDGSIKGGIRHVVFGHGHQSLWSMELLVAVLQSLGFLTYPEEIHRSCNPELRDIEQHWKVVGKENAWIESISIEALKR